jgi:hypothetical protein
MPGSPSKRPRLPHEEVRFRDPEIERKRDPSYSAENLRRMIRKASGRRRRPE